MMTLHIGDRVSGRLDGLGTVVKVRDAETQARYPDSTAATVQFDHGKRYVVLVKRLTKCV
jgi:hypothetical protein